MSKVMIYGEIKGGKLKKTAFELASEGRRLADKLGGELGAVLMGPQAEPFAQEVGRSGVASIADCVSFELDGSKLVGTRPMFAGKCYTKWVSNGSPQMATARPNVLETAEAAKDAKVEKVTFSADKSGGTYTTQSLNLDTSGAVDLTEAEIIVSGGRGMGGSDYSLLEEMASIFGPRCAVGASRAAVDAGWRPQSHQG